MSGIHIDIEKLFDFRKLRSAYPHLSARVLAYIGGKSMRYIVSQHLSGQDLTYHSSGVSAKGVPLSTNKADGKQLRSFGKPNRGGRHMIRYGFMRGMRGVYVYSKPLRYQESRKHIIIRSRTEISGRLQSWLDHGLKKSIENDPDFKEFFN
jgi:hypothetical protein